MNWTGVRVWEPETPWLPALLPHYFFLLRSCREWRRRKGRPRATTSRVHPSRRRPGRQRIGRRTISSARLWSRWSRWSARPSSSSFTFASSLDTSVGVGAAWCSGAAGTAGMALPPTSSPQAAAAAPPSTTSPLTRPPTTSSHLTVSTSRRSRLYHSPSSQPSRPSTFSTESAPSAWLSSRRTTLSARCRFAPMPSTSTASMSGCGPTPIAHSAAPPSFARTPPRSSPWGRRASGPASTTSSLTLPSLRRLRRLHRHLFLSRRQIRTTPSPRSLWTMTGAVEVPCAISCSRDLTLSGSSATWLRTAWSWTGQRPLRGDIAIGEEDSGANGGHLPSAAAVGGHPPGRRACSPSGKSQGSRRSSGGEGSSLCPSPAFDSPGAGRRPGVPGQWLARSWSSPGRSPAPRPGRRAECAAGTPKPCSPRTASARTTSASRSPLPEIAGGVLL